MMKKWIMRGCALVAAGLLLGGAGLAISGGDLQKATGGEAFEKKEYTYAPEGLTKVSIQEKDAPVTLGVSPDGNIHLTCYESAKSRYQVSKSQGWAITKQTVRHWTDQIMSFNLGSGDRPLTLLLPAGVPWDVTLASDMGDITVTGGAYAGLSLDTDYGAVSLTDVTASSLAVASSQGDLSLERVSVAGPAAMDTDYGVVDLSQVEAEEDLLVNTAQGAVTLEDVKAARIEAGSDYGDMRLKNTSAQDQIQVETDQGAIRLKEVSAGKSLSFQTDYGDITGSLAGKMSAYSIESKTDFGESNLPPLFQEGDILLHVYTDQGEIDITFS